jgi:hypothetical protein
VVEFLALSCLSESAVSPCSDPRFYSPLFSSVPSRSTNRTLVSRHRTPYLASGKLAPAVPENHTVLPPQESAKITARTDLVLVPVIVTDKSGKNVSGLPKEAFLVEENGKSRGISVFKETKTEKLVEIR